MLGACKGQRRTILANLVVNKRSDDMATKDDLDNHSNQLNPNNDAYWESRGWDDRPDDWEDRLDSDEVILSGS